MITHVFGDQRARPDADRTSGTKLNKSLFPKNSTFAPFCFPRAAKISSCWSKSLRVGMITFPQELIGKDFLCIHALSLFAPETQT